MPGMEHLLLYHQRAMLRAHRPQEVIQGGFGVSRPAELQGAQLKGMDGSEEPDSPVPTAHRCVPLHHGDGREGGGEQQPRHGQHFLH